MMYYFQTCLNLFRFNMMWIVTIHRILKHVWTCSNMSKLVQIQYEFSNMSEPVETCLNLFRFNMIWIDAILKHVWTCSNMSKLVQIQYDMNWCDMILKHVWTCSNLFKLVQIQYDTNCYNSCDSQTCLNLLKHV